MSLSAPIHAFPRQSDSSRTSVQYAYLIYPPRLPTLVDRPEPSISLGGYQEATLDPAAALSRCKDWYCETGSALRRDAVINQVGLRTRPEQSKIVCPRFVSQPRVDAVPSDLSISTFGIT